MDLLLSWAACQPGRPAYTYLVDGEAKEVQFTYAEVDQRARAIGAYLQASGASGERILLLYPPGLEYVAAFFGCLYAGAIAVPAVPPGQKTLSRLQAVVSDAEVNVAMTTGRILGSSLSEAPVLNAVRWVATDDIHYELAKEWKRPDVNADNIAFLQYTSGSTAAPKGVMVSHGNLLHNQRLVQRAFQHTDQTIIVSWLPLYHDMGLIGNVIQSLHLGAHCIFMSPPNFLMKPFRWLRAISRFQATTSGGPNFAYDLCVSKITEEQRRDLDLSSWNAAFNGSEPVRSDTLDRFTAAFGPVGFRRESFYPCYGLAEATLFVTGGLISDPPTLLTVHRSTLSENLVEEADDRDEDTLTLVGCGQPSKGSVVLVVDPATFTECAADRVGEIWISNSSVAKGYWNRCEETEHTFNAYLGDTLEGPFLRTGDLGFMDNGQLFITGRLKDLIIIGGANHYPEDIEQTVIRSHTAIRTGSCAAFSLDIDNEERLVIVAEVEKHIPTITDRHVASGLEPEGQVGLYAKVVSTVRRAVAEHHSLRAHQVLLIKRGSIPKTSSGKVQRNACRSRFLAGSLPPVEE